MFKSIIDFFRNLFQAIFGGKGTSTTSVDHKEYESSLPDLPNQPETNPVEPETIPEVFDETLPSVDELEAQDASEVMPDSTVTVVTENVPDIIEVKENGDVDIHPTGGSTAGSTATSHSSDSNHDGNSSRKPQYLWCLDNGHGNKTPGKRSPKLPNGKQFFEYEFNRDIVRRIQEQLDDYGIRYFVVVPENNVDNFLKGRVARANAERSELPKLFLSIHSNAAPAPAGKWANPSISGIETWYFHNSNKGKKIASVFQKHLVGTTGWKNRHIKSQQSNQFYVLRNTNMPAILTENGFYNNKEECKELLKSTVRQKIADAHVAAILEIEDSMEWLKG